MLCVGVCIVMSFSLFILYRKYSTIEYLKVIVDLIDHTNNQFHIFSSIENHLLVDNINNISDLQVDWIYIMMELLVTIEVYQLN